MWKKTLAYLELDESVQQFKVHPILWFLHLNRKPFSDSLETSDNNFFYDRVSDDFFIVCHICLKRYL